LKKYKFIDDFTVTEQDGKKTLTVDLNKFRSANEDIPVIKFYSKPSRRVYVSYHDLKPVAGHGGIGIISTNQ
jgi:ribosomal protein S8